MPQIERVSFRFHGPLYIESELGEKSLSDGILDVVPVPGRDGLPPTTHLRWRARAGEEAKTLGGPVLNWHVAASDIWYSFDEPPAEVRFDIGSPGEEVPPVFLRFSGVTAMDRIDPKRNALPDMRIPSASPTDSWIRVGVREEDDALDFVFSYQIAIPIPLAFGTRASNFRHALILGADHLAGQADASRCQVPDVVFTPKYQNAGDDDRLAQNWRDRSGRFGEFTLLHDPQVAALSMLGKSGDAPDRNDTLDLGRMRKLRLLTVPMLKNVELVSDDAVDIKPQDGTAPVNGQRIVLGTVPEGTGFRVTTRSQVRHGSGEPIIGIQTERQLARNLKALGQPNNGRVNVELSCDTVIDDANLAATSAAPARSDAKLALELVIDANRRDALTLEAADQVMDAERAALLVARGQPQSFLPKFEVISGTAHEAWLQLHAAVRATTPVGGGTTIDVDPVHGDVVPVAVTLAPLDAEDGDNNKLSLRVGLPGVHIGADGAGHGTVDPHHFHLRLANAEKFFDTAPDRSFFKFEIEDDLDLIGHGGGQASHDVRLEGQLGSLFFTGLAQGTGDAPRLLDKEKGQIRLYPDTDLARYEIDLRLPLALSDVRPNTSDIPHGDRDMLREDWLIPARSPTEAAEDDQRYVLDIREQVLNEQDHHLVANLNERQSEVCGPLDDVLITRAPFAVMRLRRPGLDELASSLSSNVATYDSDARTWEFRRGGDLVPISFPASAIGDSMDKPGMRVITDGAGTASPYVRSRLSGPATIWVDTEELGRAFRTPEHNARALFGDRTEAGPGAELAGFSAELVYGLTTGWQRHRASGTLRSTVRMAETAAMMGRIVAELEDDRSGSRITTRQSVLTRLISSRPQHLGAVTRKGPGLLDDAPAAFDAGLTFVARKTAVIKPPHPGIDAANNGPDGDGQLRREHPKIALHGLDGGAFWPIEQRAFVERLFAGPVSRSGSLEGFALGPFGGSGDQTARFVNESLAIISQTRLGRLESIRIEVNGRIASFSHKAKHVVVYRRTTAASDQFASLGGDSERPILRKVEEYIDVEEQERVYPDFDNVDPRTSAAFRRLRFGTRRINVDSAWAEEVGRFGWRVPLWNHHAAAVRPVVYPRPDITAAHQGEDAERLTLQNVLDPSNLWFYTNAEYAERERDTALWPSVGGVDGSGLSDHDEWMRALDEAALDAQSDATGDGGVNASKARRPAASRIVPGMAPFTHFLAPSGALTKVNEARGDKPVFAALESFTFMRGSGDKPLPAGDGDTSLEQKVALLKAPGEFEKLLAEVKNVVANPAAGPDFLRKIEEARGEFEKILAQSDVPSEIEGARNALVTAIKDGKDVLEGLPDNDAALGQLEKALFGDNLEALRGKYADYKEDFDLLEKILAADKSDCDALQDQARAAIRAKKVLVLERLGVEQAKLLAIVEGIPNKDKLKEDIEKRRNAALELAETTVNQIGEDLGNVKAQVAKARSHVADWGASVDQAYASGLQRLDQFRTSYDQNKPWSTARIEKARRALRDELGSLTRAADAAMSEARQRLAADISGRASDVTILLDQALDQARGVLDSGSPVASPVRALFGLVEGGGTKLLDATSDAAVARVQAALEAAREGQPDTAKKAALDELATLIEAESGRVRHVLIDDATPGIAELDTAVGQAKEAAQAVVDKIEADATGAIAELEDALRDELAGLSGTLTDETDKLLDALTDPDWATYFDQMVTDAQAWITGKAGAIAGQVDVVQERADSWLEGIETGLKGAKEKIGATLEEGLKARLINPVFDAILAEIDALPDDLDLDALKSRAKEIIGTFKARLEEAAGEVEQVANQLATEVAGLCKVLVGKKNAMIDVLENGLGALKKWLMQRLEKYADRLAALSTDTVAAIWEGYAALGDVFADLQAALEEVAHGIAVALVRTAERVASVVEDIGEELADRIGRLLTVSGRIPDIGNLGLNTDRIVAFFKDIADDIDMSLSFASLGRFGDALGSFNFDIPVKGLGDGFDLPDLGLGNLKLPDFDLPDLLPKIGGIDFSDVLPDFGGAGNSLDDLKKYVKITHDLDKKAKTAWVKAELDIPFPKRAKLFGLGPFTFFMNKPVLTAWVRIEANAKTKDVTTTEKGEIKTDLEAVVGGQPLVTLREVLIFYADDGGLDFVVKPENVKLHPNFQFIQDFLSSLGLDGGDTGISLIKDGGTPVGVQHKFALPIPPLGGGTSSLVDLTIANTFQLVAYPDFFIRNRFNLSTRERPFVFAIFIIGGTGFVEVDVDYLPADSQTKIKLTAGVGGSASLSFAFGPVSGGVFITLSVILTYVKYLPANPDAKDEGLSVSLELAIVGQVSLWGIATIFLRLALSMTYRDNGSIDATGRLKVSLRVSRFFKLSFSTTVNYRLRDGKAVTTRTTDIKAEIPEQTKERAGKLKQSRAKLS